MKKQLHILAIISVILGLALAACGGPVATQPAATAAPTQAAATTAPTTPAATAAPTTPANLVTSLDNVKSATIQIEAQGTFLDPQVGMVVNGAGRGSGFIIDSSGIAVTNNHVVTGAALIKVWVGGNKDKVYSARVLGASECSDLAVIKIDGSDFPYLQWHTDPPKVGLEVYTAGFPLGDPEYTMTKGIISKENANGNTDWASVGSVLEHDARINPGNSGGPLVDKDGKVVGINYASNQSNQYFAIAKAEADKVLGDLKAGNDVDSIGVNGQVVQSQDKTISGVWVSSVKSGSPADKSGLKPGDIIVQMEGLVLGTDGTKADYCQILRSHKPTDTLSLNVLRWSTQEVLEGELNGRQLAVTGTFASASPTQTPAGETNGGVPSPTSAPTNGGTVTVTDDSKVITVTIPSDWQYDGSAWQNSWSIGGNSYPFNAQTLTASPDVTAYGNGFGTPGVFIATSRDWGNIGGYANLLEGVASFYSTCTPKTSQSYKDATYEGELVLYTQCGAEKGNAVVMALRPIKTPTAYLVLFEVKYTTQAELDAVDTILNTIDVTP
jgi:serine protease Do